MSLIHMDLVFWLIVILAFCLLAQTAFLFVALRKTDQQLVQLQTPLDKLISHTERLLGASRDVVARLQAIGENFPALERSFTQSLEKVSSSLHRADEVTAEGILAARKQVAESGRRAEFALNQFVRQTTKVHRMARTPAIQSVAIVRGATVALRQLLKRGKEPEPFRNFPDEETFI